MKEVNRHFHVKYLNYMTYFKYNSLILQATPLIIFNNKEIIEEYYQTQVLP